MFHPHVILHPTDYSECARHAFDIAVDLARQYDARLLVLHVADTLGAGTRQPRRLPSHSSPPPIRNSSARNCIGFKHPPTAVSRFSISSKKAAPATVIAGVAAREHCDMIVLGTYGRNIVSRL